MYKYNNSNIESGQAARTENKIYPFWVKICNSRSIQIKQGSRTSVAGGGYKKKATHAWFSAVAQHSK